MKKVLFAVVLLCSSAFVQGCVKRIETSGGTKIDFITGFDVGASLNGIDTVQNQRGIKPADAKN